VTPVPTPVAFSNEARLIVGTRRDHIHITTHNASSDSLQASAILTQTDRQWQVDYGRTRVARNTVAPI